MRVDDDLAALLLEVSARLELRVPMRWECRATSVRAHMGVHNSHGLPLILGAGAHPQAVEADRLPDDLRAAHPSLDVNGSHRNRTRGREEWVERTHKHWFSEAHQDTVAYIPDDIPGSPGTDVDYPGDFSWGRSSSMGPQESMTRASAALAEWKP